MKLGTYLADTVNYWIYTTKYVNESNVHSHGFKKLREELPKIKLPNFPPKSSLFTNSMDQKFIQTRITQIDKYLKELVMHPEALRSRHFCKLLKTVCNYLSAPLMQFRRVALLSTLHPKRALWVLNRSFMQC